MANHARHVKVMMKAVPDLKRNLKNCILCNICIVLTGVETKAKGGFLMWNDRLFIGSDIVTEFLWIEFVITETHPQSYF